MRSRWPRVLAWLVGLSLLLWPAAAGARQPGSFDPSFGNRGIALYQFGAGGSAAASQVSALARQRDGKLVIGGFATDASGNREFMVARLRSNGALDPSFGDDGRVVTQVDSGTGASSEVFALAIQPDGKILAAGTTAQLRSGFFVARLRPDGSFDPTFGSQGKLELPVGDDEFQPADARALALQPDGRILVAGNTGGFQEALVVARLTSRGELDTSFGQGGEVFFLQTGGVHPSSRAEALALQPDGRIVVGGDQAFGGFDRALVLRLHGSDGSLDPSFGAGGALVYGPFFITTAHAVALQPDGRVVFAGEALSDATGQLLGTGLIGRLTQSGELDTTFGDAGTDTSGPFSNQSAHAAAIEPGGQIVIGGAAFDANGNGSFLVEQLNGSDGALDPSFGSGGKVVDQITSVPPPDFRPGFSTVNALALEPDGKVVAAGYAGPDLFVARLANRRQ